MRDCSPKNRVILGVRSPDELEAQQVPIRMRFGPHDLGVLDRLMVRRGANTQRANLPHRDSRIDRDTEPADTRVDRQAGSADGP